MPPNKGDSGPPVRRKHDRKSRGVYRPPTRGAVVFFHKHVDVHGPYWLLPLPEREHHVGDPILSGSYRRVRQLEQRHRDLKGPTPIVHPTQSVLPAEGVIDAFGFHAEKDHGIPLSPYDTPGNARWEESKLKAGSRSVTRRGPNNGRGLDLVSLGIRVVHVSILFSIS